MLSRKTAYYGLLACLVPLLALGSLPSRIGKLAEQRGPAERAPGEEPGDEERESEPESKEIAPLRRRISVWHQAPVESRFPRREPSHDLRVVSYDALPSLSGEQAARNGIGGPLRL
jgi:hypothetical protein